MNFRNRTRVNKKYGNHKVEINGIKFDSRKEANRYLILKEMENRGEISNLQLQVKYILIPSQRAAGEYVGRNNRFKQGKVIEQAVTYIADFVYRCNGKTIVEDTKGFKTKDYIIKRKLMLFVHGIQIEEI